MFWEVQKMKYCQYCGTKLADEAKFCSSCGKSAYMPYQAAPPHGACGTSHHQTLINTLSTRMNTNGIIWVVIACIQIIIGLSGVWFTLIVGVLNILSAVSDIKTSKAILTNPIGIVQNHTPISGAIVTLIYNVVIGGVIGVLGSIYYLVCVREYVMENKAQFLEMEMNAQMH